MRFQHTLVAFLICLLSSPILAKTLQNKEKVDQASELFMSQIQTGEVESAFSIMAAYLGVDMTKFLERSEKTTKEMQQVEKGVGKPLSYALLKKQSVDDHFYKVSYLLKYESAALVWELNFYQPAQGWKLVDISYHANIDELFSE